MGGDSWQNSARRNPMKKSKYSDSQIVSILKEAEAGQPVKEICRKYGISVCHEHTNCEGGVELYER
jgi:putative transposase